MSSGDHAIVVKASIDSMITFYFAAINKMIATT